MSADQLTTAAMMTSMPPNLGDDSSAMTMTATPAPYIDFRDELLFDPDELEAPGSGAGYRLPGDAVVPGTSMAPTMAPATVAGPSSVAVEPPSSENSLVTVNLLEDSKEPPETTGLGMWQSILIAVGMCIFCILVIVFLIFGPRLSMGGGGGRLDAGAMGGYGGSGF